MDQSSARASTIVYTPEVSTEALRKSSRSIYPLITKWRETGWLSLSEHEDLREQLLLWLESEAVSCLNWLNEQGVSTLLDADLMTAWVDNLAETSPSFVLRVASELNNPLSQSELYSLFIEAQLKKEPTGLINFLGSVPRHLRLSATRKLAGRLASDDPKSAFTTLVNSGDGNYFSLSKVVDTWAADKPEEALRYIITGVSDAELAKSSNGQLNKRDLIGTCLDRLVRKSPETGLKVLQNLSVDFSVSSWMIETAGVVIARHPENAEAWLATLPDASAREMALASAARASKPDSVARIASMIESGVMRSSVFATKAQDMVILSAPEKALSWADSVSDPLGRSAALNAVGKWSFTKAPGNAVETAANIAGISDGTFSSSVLRELDSRIANSQIATDLSWVDKLSAKTKGWLEAQRPGVIKRAAAFKK